MADIVSLIAKHGEGGHDYPLRQAQMAQAERTQQATDIDRQRAQEQSEMRELEIQKQRREFGRQTELDNISRNSTTTDEWITQLEDKGYRTEAQQAKVMKNTITKQTMGIEESKRESAQEEAFFLAQILTDVESLEEQTTALEMFDKRYPESDIDEMIDRKVYDENLLAMYRYSALSAAESIKIRRQESIDKRAADNLAARLKGQDIKIAGQELKGERLNIKRTDELRKEFKKATGASSESLSQLSKAKTMLKTNKGLGAKLTQAIIANQSGSKVRALAELVQYRPGQFGDIMQRIAGKMGTFIAGGYSPEETKEIEGIIKELEEFYEGLNAELKDYYRYLAEEGKLDSHSVAKYNTPEEVAQNRWMSDEQKTEALYKYFPKQFPRPEKK